MWIGEKFLNACARAAIERRKIKETRHTFATLALQNNVHPKKVQEAMGHASVKITLDIYSHLVPALHEDSMQHLDRLFA